MACFAFRFLLLSSCPLLFSFRSALVLLPCLASALGLVLLSWLCGLAFGVGWVVGFLSLSDGFRYKKERAQSVCVLSCPVVCVKFLYSC